MLKKSGDNQTYNKKSRPNLLSETLLKKAKDAIVGSHLASTLISRSMLIAIGTRVVKANDPCKAFASLRSNRFFSFRYTTTHSSLFQSEKDYLAVQEKVLNTGTINTVRLLTTSVVQH